MAKALESQGRDGAGRLHVATEFVYQTMGNSVTGRVEVGEQIGNGFESVRIYRDANGVEWAHDVHEKHGTGPLRRM